MGVDLCLCKYILNLKIMNNKTYFLKEKKDSYHACKWVNYTSLTLIRNNLNVLDGDSEALKMLDFFRIICIYLD